jgi:hypothetical protein
VDAFYNGATPTFHFVAEVLENKFRSVKKIEPPKWVARMCTRMKARNVIASLVIQSNSTLAGGL